MAVADEIRRQQEYHRHMGRGSLAIDDQFDMATFDLNWHFERAGEGTTARVVPVLTQALKEWAKAYREGKQTLDFTPEQKAMLGKFNPDFRASYFGKKFAEEFKDQIVVPNLFDPHRENTISPYGVSCLLLSLFLRDPKIVAGDFPSAGHKYSYMASLKFAIHEIFNGHLIPSLWCIHVPGNSRH
ncbi:MAG: hypothetical protein HY710_14550 [Candidatus Latescibacteria bacterium]|nr:hypothetical protein [Candidatus Latescibacterota bacterium]